MSATTHAPHPANFDRDDVRVRLSNFLVRRPLFASGAPVDGLADYKRHVLRWMDCAPEGALFLPAPLSGWRGEPFTMREPQGPSHPGSKALREARARRGLHPITGERVSA
jgi:hypothetical protein